MDEKQDSEKIPTNTNNPVLAELMKGSLSVNSANDQLLSTPQKDELKALEKKSQATSVYDRLTPEEQVAAQQLSTTLNQADPNSVLDFGSNAQKNLTNFSQSVLNKVTRQDIASVGDALNQLMYNLKEAKPDELSQGEPGFFQRMFGKIKKSIYEITAKYQKIGATIDQVAIKLDTHKDQLLQDNKMLEDLYTQNLDYFKALNVYIAAVELKITQLTKEDLPQAIAKTKDQSDPMSAQVVNDLNQYLERLGKRSYDLKLARQITIQQAPQIRLIQNTNQALAEKIHTSINTAIPLWKNQVVIALTLLKQKDAATAQRQVTETTNELLAKNSEMLKVSALETAKENERGIVDLATLQKTQDNLITTIEETMQIQKVGREKRQEAELELQKMEENLKNKLLELNRQDHEN